MGNIYVLVGQTASGKTEIFKRLIEKVVDIKPIVTTTSRPPRVGEVNGKDYYFEHYEYVQNNKEKFICLEQFIVEPHDLCYYGIDTVENDLEDTSVDKIVILTPRGYRELKEKYGDRVIGYYIMAPEKVRRERYLSREKFSYIAKERIDRRIEADFIDFKDFEFEVENLIINTTKEQFNDAVEAITFDIILDRTFKDVGEGKK